MTIQEAIKSILPTEYLDIFLEEELSIFIEKLSQNVDPDIEPETILLTKWTPKILGLLNIGISNYTMHLMYIRPLYFLEVPTVFTSTALKFLCQHIKARIPIYIQDAVGNNKLLLEKFKGHAYGSSHVNWLDPGYLLGKPMHVTHTIHQEWTHSVATQGDTPIHFLEVISYHFSGYTYRKTNYLFKLGEIYGATSRIGVSSPDSSSSIKVARNFYTLLSSSLYIYPIKDHTDSIYSELLLKVIPERVIEQRKIATIDSVLSNSVERYYFQVSNDKAFIVCYECNTRIETMAIEAELISLTSNIISDARV